MRSCTNTIREILSLREKGDKQAAESAYKKIDPLSRKVVGYLESIVRKAH